MTDRSSEVPPSHIFLVGYRCTGKTTVGTRLADHLERPFHDTDDLIQERMDASIQDIWADQGPSFFRDVETDILQELQENPPAVIATGGGCVEREKNRTVLDEEGTVIWLRASPEVIRKRMSLDHDKQRPVLGDDSMSAREEIHEILAQRKPLYRHIADRSIVTDDTSPETLVEQIILMLEHLQSA